MVLAIRRAEPRDVPALIEVMDRAILENQRAFLSDEQIDSSRAIMGIDDQLVADGTYFVVEVYLENESRHRGSDTHRHRGGGDNSEAEPDRLGLGSPFPPGSGRLTGHNSLSRIAGCGGWSRRATLYGHNATHGRDARLLDPATEPARVRAMYTDPPFTRRGVGRAILVACEDAARAEGFRRLELMSTLSGQPLYAAYGFRPVEEVLDDAGGAAVPLVRMTKPVDPAG